MQFGVGHSGTIRVSKCFFGLFSELIKGSDQGSLVNDSLGLIVCPNCCRASRHEGKSLQHLCFVIQEGSWLNSNGEFHRTNEPFCICPISTELLWISCLDGAMRGGSW